MNTVSGQQPAIVEEITEISRIHGHDCRVKVRILKCELPAAARRFIRGEYGLDTWVGARYSGKRGLTYDEARYAASRFLLEHVDGIAPVLH
ncbi:hypothetical protein [Burkholderia multivorans]|uniref:hypothetical protein n=1 Tax=Burkholderia multivorans TaxID=87883 RepID=UPI00158D947B|nr:hypothetical protein [Burkholderia multivorans]MCL4630014.1 hypothetical protein [Burkholderia multivorans]MCO1386236.1 hypothetical protein [Burkholderia multivorans]MCO1389236.1 hypothetical protein [Burkholderia multivorans]UQO10870.1 hypothetical protein L0Z40_12485 [Burkholderia multivorans]UQO57250.1 hypothetical protein L0Z30_12845 [Burkholderia multivorans]